MSEEVKVLRSRCALCRALTPINQLVYPVNLNGENEPKEERICSICVSHRTCHSCRNVVAIINERRMWNDDINLYCNRCDDNIFECDRCLSYYDNTEMTDCPCEEDEQEEEEIIQEQEYINPICSVDIEHGKKELGKCRVSGDIIKSPRMFGIEFELVPQQDTRSCVRSAHTLLSKITPKYWGVTTDASLPSGSLEVQTAPVSMSIGENQVKDFLKEINESKLWKITDRCGTHVHIDCSDIIGNFIRMRKLMSAFFVLDDVIISMLPPQRRTNRYCSPLTRGKAIINRDRSFDKGFDMEEILKMQSSSDLLHTYYKTSPDNIKFQMHNHSTEARYYGINFHSLFDGRGTVENRYHEGTIDANNILMWTKLNQHIVDTSRIITIDNARILYEIKDIIERLDKYSEITSMDKMLYDYCINRINKFK